MADTEDSSAMPVADGAAAHDSGLPEQKPGTEEAPEGGEVAEEKADGAPAVTEENLTEGDRPDAEDAGSEGMFGPGLDQTATAPAEESEAPARPAKRGPSFPSILAELGLKVTAKGGVLLPESRRTLLKRRREMRTLALGEMSAEDRLVAIADDEARRAGSKQKVRGRASHKGAIGVQLNEMQSDLFYGSHQGNLEACRTALGAGVDINTRTNADLDGVGTAATALHVASHRGHEDVVAALLRAGADPLLASGRAETAVQLATRMGHVGVVKLVREAGGAPSGADGMSQLMNSAPASWDDGKRRKLQKALAPPPRPISTLPRAPVPPNAHRSGDDRHSAHPGDGGEDGRDSARGDDYMAIARHSGKSGGDRSGKGKGKKGDGKGKGKDGKKGWKGKGKD
mmetsp:Transcript_17496/g.31069  ORF Transcript_17496/g.31069 Transcript_17496/m.31069 type:complete len:399 (+) Transcript_17496:68-1264(+)